jgi:hypothetical protein
MVHYGYDRKDADPSTYNVEVVAPFVIFKHIGDSFQNHVRAQAMCLNMSWTMQRFGDDPTRAASPRSQ